MKTFFYMGRNPNTKSGVSWKIWKIERQRRTVTVLWGPARLLKRKVLPVGALQKKRYPIFDSVQDARDFEAKRIRSKLKKGYQSKPRRRATR